MTTAAAAPPSRRSHRHGLLWPLLLIGVGLIALLGNFGLIDLPVVALLALWPVLLILLGIDIAFARRWPLPTVALEVVVIIAAIAYAVAYPTSLSLGSINLGSTGDCRAPTRTVSIPRGAQSLALRLSGGATRYHLTGGANGLLEATSERDDLCFSQRAEASGSSRADVRLSQANSSFGSRSAGIEVRVANDVPLSLQLDGGAGEFSLDLSDVRTTDARLSVGASSTTLVLPRPSGEVAIRVNGGASSVVLEIPSGVEARITVSGGLVSSSVQNPRATKDGSVIQTAGYATARDRVTVTVNGGATSVSVR